MKGTLLLASCLSLATLTGCTYSYSVNDVILGNSNGFDKPKNEESQLAKRSYQSRIFSTDTANALKNIVATLQDQDYVIERTDKTLNTVSASRTTKGFITKITITVRQKDRNQVVVRANALRNSSPVDDPKFYQIFFNALSQSLFLEAQDID